MDRVCIWSGVRPLWNRWLGFSVRRLQRHRYERLVLEDVAGTPLAVLPEVFNPALLRTGEFLGQTLAAQVRPGQRVLDLGTGSGVGAVFAARGGAQVVAVDISPAAVRCARANVLLHDLEERVEVRTGDLFAPVRGERFDWVSFNPPYFRGAPRSALDRAWRSEDALERFAAGLTNVLAPDGQGLLVLSSHADVEAILALCRKQGLASDLLAERDLINEVLVAYTLRVEGGRPPPPGSLP